MTVAKIAVVKIGTFLDEDTVTYHTIGVTRSEDAVQFSFDYYMDTKWVKLLPESFVPCKDENNEHLIPCNEIDYEVVIAEARFWGHIVFYTKYGVKKFEWEIYDLFDAEDLNQ